MKSQKHKPILVEGSPDVATVTLDADFPRVTTEQFRAVTSGLLRMADIEIGQLSYEGVAA